tara:strand:- start:23140 stop:23454 length:315 start_codon:yes stop_codon:yes gene_type:complete
MVVQTLSVASDVLPFHLGDIHQDHTHHASDEPSPATSDAPTDHASSESQSSPDDCYDNHCHGSHLLLAMHVANLPVSPAGHFVPCGSAGNTSTHLDTALRPPIA